MEGIPHPSATYALSPYGVCNSLCVLSKEVLSSLCASPWPEGDEQSGLRRYMAASWHVIKGVLHGTGGCWSVSRLTKIRTFFTDVSDLVPSSETTTDPAFVFDCFLTMWSRMFEMAVGERLRQVLSFMVQIACKSPVTFVDDVSAFHDFLFAREGCLERVASSNAVILLNAFMEGLEIGTYGETRDTVNCFLVAMNMRMLTGAGRFFRRCKVIPARPLAFDFLAYQSFAVHNEQVFQCKLTRFGSLLVDLLGMQMEASKMREYEMTRLVVKLKRAVRLDWSRRGAGDEEREMMMKRISTLAGGIRRLHASS